MYEQHTFQGRAGQSVTITLESRDFDTYVAIFSPDGKLLAKNDDISKSSSNSGLTVTLPASGRYRVIVNAYKKGEGGRYTLTVR
ncbi:MAG: PPC domain-containing protein [Microcoleus sp.]